MEEKERQIQKGQETDSEPFKNDPIRVIVLSHLQLVIQMLFLDKHHIIGVFHEILKR